MTSQELQLTGIHHLTAVTARASDNHAFYTQTLGLRLVKKTVNQDDVSAYHLFYADGKGSPGTDLTFFDWPAARERRGGNSIARTGLRIPPSDALAWWSVRLREQGVAISDPMEQNGRRTLEFEDPEGQRLALVEDAEPGEFAPWEQSPVPADFQIRGLGPVTLSVHDFGPLNLILTNLLNMRNTGEYSHPGTDTEIHVFSMGSGGPAAELHVAIQTELPPTRPGAGGVHHVAFRVPTFEQYDRWNDRLREYQVPSSGPVDRFYFRSLYFREPNGILFELATDEPGFTADEPLEKLGQGLALPPFLEPRRREIEANLKPL